MNPDRYCNSSDHMKQTFITALSNILGEKYSLSIHQLMQHLSLPLPMRNSFSSYESFERFLKSNPDVFVIDRFNNVTLTHPPQTKWPFENNQNYVNEHSTFNESGEFTKSNCSVFQSEPHTFHHNSATGYENYRPADTSLSFHESYGAQCCDSHDRDTSSSIMPNSIYRREKEDTVVGFTGESSSYKRQETEETWKPEKVDRFIADLLLSAGKDVYERTLEGNRSLWPGTSAHNADTVSVKTVLSSESKSNSFKGYDHVSKGEYVKEQRTVFVSEGRVRSSNENDYLKRVVREVCNETAVGDGENASVQWMSSKQDFPKQNTSCLSSDWKSGTNIVSAESCFDEMLRSNSPWEQEPSHYRDVERFKSMWLKTDVRQSDESNKSTVRSEGRRESHKLELNKYDEFQEKGSDRSRDGGKLYYDIKPRLDSSLEKTRSDRAKYQDLDYKYRKSAKKDFSPCDKSHYRSRSRSPLDRRKCSRGDSNLKSSDISDKPPYITRLDHERYNEISKEITSIKQDSFETSQLWNLANKQPPIYVEPVPQWNSTVSPSQQLQVYDASLSSAKAHTSSMVEEKRIVSTESYSVAENFAAHSENVIHNSLQTVGQFPVQQNIYPYNWPNPHLVPGQFISVIPQIHNQYGVSSQNTYTYFPVQEAASNMPPAFQYQHPSVQFHTVQQPYQYVASSEQPLKKERQRYYSSRRSKSRSPNNFELDGWSSSNRSVSPRYNRSRSKERHRSPIRRRSDSNSRSRSRHAIRIPGRNKRHTRSRSPMIHHRRQTRLFSQTKSLRKDEKIPSIKSISTNDESFEEMAVRYYYRRINEHPCNKSKPLINIADSKSCIKLSTGKLYEYMTKKYAHSIQWFFEKHRKYFAIDNDGVVNAVKNVPEKSVKDIKTNKTDLSRVIKQIDNRDKEQQKTVKNKSQLDKKELALKKEKVVGKDVKLKENTVSANSKRAVNDGKKERSIRTSSVTVKSNKERDKSTTKSTNILAISDHKSVSFRNVKCDKHSTSGIGNRTVTKSEQNALKKHGGNHIPVRISRAIPSIQFSRSSQVSRLTSNYETTACKTKACSHYKQKSRTSKNISSKQHIDNNVSTTLKLEDYLEDISEGEDDVLGEEKNDTNTISTGGSGYDSNAEQCNLAKSAVKKKVVKENEKGVLPMKSAQNAGGRIKKTEVLRVKKNQSNVTVESSTIVDRKLGDMENANSIGEKYVKEISGEKSMEGGDKKHTPKERHGDGKPDITLISAEDTKAVKEDVDIVDDAGGNVAEYEHGGAPGEDEAGEALAEDEDVEALEEDDDDGGALDEDGGAVIDEDEDIGVVVDEDEDGGAVVDEDEDGGAVVDEDEDIGAVVDEDGGAVVDEDEDGGAVVDEDGGAVVDEDEDGGALVDKDEDGGTVVDEDDEAVEDEENSESLEDGDSEAVEDDEDDKDGEAVEDYEDGEAVEDYEDGEAVEDNEDGEAVEDNEDCEAVEDNEDCEAEEDDKYGVAIEEEDKDGEALEEDDDGEYPVENDDGEDSVEDDDAEALIEDEENNEYCVEENDKVSSEIGSSSINEYVSIVEENYGTVLKEDEDSENAVEENENSDNILGEASDNVEDGENGHNIVEETEVGDDEEENENYDNAEDEDCVQEPKEADISKEIHENDKEKLVEEKNKKSSVVIDDNIPEVNIPSTSVCSSTVEENTRDVQMETLSSVLDEQLETISSIGEEQMDTLSLVGDEHFEVISSVGDESEIDDSESHLVSTIPSMTDTELNCSNTVEDPCLHKKVAQTISISDLVTNAQIKESKTDKKSRTVKAKKPVVKKRCASRCSTRGATRGRNTRLASSKRKLSQVDQKLKERSTVYNTRHRRV